MNLFSPNAFLLGTVASAVLISGGNVIYSLLCKAFKIRVLEFVTFYKLWLPLHSVSIGHTKYILGWVPTGSSIKVLGVGMEEEERAQIAAEDLQYAWFSKPLWVRILLRSIAFVLIAALFGVTTAMLSGGQGWMETVTSYLTYVGDAFSTMFTDRMSHDQFLAESKALLGDHNPAVFGLALFSVVWVLCLPLSLVMLAASLGGEKRYYRILSILGWLALLPATWFILWKVPSFVFSFFSWTEIFIHVANIVVGIFVTGLVLHLLTLLVAKLSFKTQ